MKHPNTCWLNQAGREMRDGLVSHPCCQVSHGREKHVGVCNQGQGKTALQMQASPFSHRGQRHSWDGRQGVIHGDHLLRQNNSVPCWPTVGLHDSSRNSGGAQFLGLCNDTGLLTPRNLNIVLSTAIFHTKAGRESY